MASKPKRPRDPNQLAAAIVAEAVGDAEKVAEPPKNEAAVALSLLGASKGGKARRDKLSPERRKEISAKAIAARWKKKR
jgi:hypothetical protein